MTENPKKKIKGPKEDLISGQGNEINKMFFRDFMKDYFDIKVANLLSIMNFSDKHINMIVGQDLVIDKLKINFDKIKNDDYVKYAKAEIISTYYHSIETFIRLFISMATFNESPLIEITCLNINNYRKALEKISNDNFNEFNDKLMGDELILYLLTGFRDFEKCPIKKENFKKMKEWIIFFAHELQNMGQYNSFKHGLNMFIGTGGIKIENNEIKIEKQGDAVHLLESKVDNNRFRLSMSSIFIDYEIKITIIKIASEMIRNILIIGEKIYIGSDITKIPGLTALSISYNELSDLICKQENIGAKMSSYGQPLSYEDDL